jgi:hypothetical protein
MTFSNFLTQILTLFFIRRVFDVCKIFFTLNNVSASKEKPFQISCQKNVFLELLEDKLYYEFEYSFEQYQDGDILLYLEISDHCNQYYEEVQMNLSKFGFHIQIKVTCEQLIFLQSCLPFKFARLEDRIVSMDEIKPKIVEPVETVEDEELGSLFVTDTSKEEYVPKVKEVSVNKFEEFKNPKVAVEFLQYLLDFQEISEDEFNEQISYF